MMLSTIGNVISSSQAQQSATRAKQSESGETYLPVASPEQIASANATLRAMDSLSLGLGGGLVPGQNAAVLNVSGVEIQAQMLSNVTALAMKSSSGGAFSVQSPGSLPSGAVSVCASFSVSPASLYGGPDDSGLFSLSFFDCATRSPIEYVLFNAALSSI